MNPRGESNAVFPAARRKTRAVVLGGMTVGGNAPVRVQTMTKTDTRDVEATVAQIGEAAAAGCDIVRLAVPDAEAARALKDIRPRCALPLVADIHFDYRLALAALEAGVDGLRLNPGNIGNESRVRAVAEAARARGTPIRVGVNAGSIAREIRDRLGSGVEAMVESALQHVALLEKHGVHAIKISVKASDVSRTVRAYRLLADRCDYPLHLGVTEAGTMLNGAIRSSAALAVLLGEGIGDTIRISLADHPVREVRVGVSLLRALGLRAPGPEPIVCPTCGRTRVDVFGAAEALERRLDAWVREHPDRSVPRLAVMGCVVNGPGEAREADLALVGGDGVFWLFSRGRKIGAPMERDAAVTAILRAVEAWPRDPAGT